MEQRGDAVSGLREQIKHGRPGFPMAVYINDFDIYVNHMIPWHYHDELEFVVVTQGKVTFSIGTEKFLLYKGQGVFINSGVLHQMVPEGKETAYMFSILVNAGMLGTEKGVYLMSEYVLPYLKATSCSFEKLDRDREWKQRILENLQRIKEAYMNQTDGYEYELHILICQVWYILWKELFQKIPQNRMNQRTSDERVYQALQYVDLNFQRNISMEEWCQSLSISKSELCRCFQRNLRMTPFEYLMTFRVNHAAKLLMETKDSVSLVAMNSGFQSDSYFCRQFRRYMGCTPKEYRKRTK